MVELQQSKLPKKGRRSSEAALRSGSESESRRAGLWPENRRSTNNNEYSAETLAASWIVVSRDILDSGS